MEEIRMRRKNMLRYCVLVLVAASFAIVPSGAQQKRGPSTPEERAKAVMLAHQLEDQPLGPGAADARKWLTVWLIEIPDISVEVCPSVLGPGMDSKKNNSTEIWTQMMYSQLAFMIENPDKAKDRDAVFVAGVKGALKAYQAIQKDKPKTQFKSLDELLAQQQNGTLDDAVRKSVAVNCKPNK
jgi:hypothetical protein